jgi:hypothetical protein
MSKKITDQLGGLGLFGSEIFVDIENNNSDSTLKADGALYWSNARAGSILKGSFTIENVGLPASAIDWKVNSYPSWGKWSFDPIQGNALTPESGPLTINVSVDMPFKIKRNL